MRSARVWWETLPALEEDGGGAGEGEAPALTPAFPGLLEEGAAGAKTAGTDAEEEVEEESVEEGVPEAAAAELASSSAA